ncbi:hypothetical protein B0H19DRAFT_1370735 [Mycena capillaripes]|nr:hypothetical protein B0H19DRAFT_1370735 [Mycena capillaripes]
MLPALLLATFAGVGSALTLSARDGTPLANVYTQCVSQGIVAFTFDDGPYKWMKNISDLFTKAGGHCTFFVNGNNWDCIYNHVQDIEYTYQAGHQIASHTWSHADLQTLSANQMHAEINQVDVALGNIINAIPTILRPPYGSSNDTVRALVATHNKSMVTWDFELNGRESRDVQKVIRRCQNVGQPACVKP